MKTKVYLSRALKSEDLLASLLLTLLFSYSLIAQGDAYPNAASEAQPFGKLHPEAPSELGDYGPLIGTCDCKSSTKNQDGTWADPIDMQWTFKYILNGLAVQDETLKSDGRHTGSIRQYSVDSLRWYVHYFTSQTPAPSFGVWEGGKKGDEIVLYRPQKAPNGMDGFYKIRFYNISEEGFDWLGAWTTKEEDFFYENWKINCRKRAVK